MFLPSVVEDRENSTCFVSGGQRGAAYLWDWGGGVVQTQRNMTSSTARDLGILGGGGGILKSICTFVCVKQILYFTNYYAFLL